MALVNVDNLSSVVYGAVQNAMKERGLSISVASRITCVDFQAITDNVVEAITLAESSKDESDERRSR